MMLCQRCGQGEAEVFQTQVIEGKSYNRDLCQACASIDYGVFLGALLQSQAPGAPPLTTKEQEELRRVLDEAAPPDNAD